MITLPKFGIFLILLLGLSEPSRSQRTFAIGDLHGDLRNSLRCLQLCNLTDPEGNWIGGSATLVQTGDVVDRGPYTRKILDLLQRMGQQAAAAGGRVVRLLGNHEVMAFKGRTKYTHKGEIESFGGPEGRLKAFSKEGPYGYLRNSDSFAIVANTLFVHAGLTPALIKLGMGLNEEVRKQVELRRWNSLVLGDDSPSWSRLLIRQAEKGNCSTLRSVLRSAETMSGKTIERMVVGHTIQHTGVVGRFCDGLMVAIDISISSYNKLGDDNIAAIEIVQQTSTNTAVEILAIPHAPKPTSNQHKSTSGHKAASDVHKSAPDAHQTKPDAQKSAVDVHKTGPDTHKIAPDVNKKAPDFNKKAPDVDKKAPNVNKKTPEAHKNAADVPKSALDVNKNAPDVNKKAPDAHQSAADVHKNAADVRKNAADVHENAADVHKNAADVNKNAADVHKSPPTDNKAVPGVPKKALDVPKSAPDVPKMAPDVNKKALDAHKNAADAHKIGPNAPKNGEAPSMHPGITSNGPGKTIHDAQIASNGSKLNPNSHQVASSNLKVASDDHEAAQGGSKASPTSNPVSSAPSSQVPQKKPIPSKPVKDTTLPILSDLGKAPMPTHPNMEHPIQPPPHPTPNDHTVPIAAAHVPAPPSGHAEVDVGPSYQGSDPDMDDHFHLPGEVDKMHKDRAFRGMGFTMDSEKGAREVRPYWSAVFPAVAAVALFLYWAIWMRGSRRRRRQRLIQAIVGAGCATLFWVRMQHYS